MEWIDTDTELWEIRFWGSLYHSSEELDGEQCVFVVDAEGIEEAIEAVKYLHDEHAIVKVAVRHYAIDKTKPKKQIPGPQTSG